MRRIFGSAILILVLISAATGVNGQETPPPEDMIFILDASGSMWGQVEGRSKIEVAREVLIGLIRDLPDNARVGLTAYGHRSKGDCRDVEELFPLAPIEKDKLAAAIDSLNPKGKTPIHLSVKMTAEKLRDREDAATVILVSDGKETCGGDPCALVEELRESGVKFVMHVIGFDVTAEEGEQLTCMAEAGGGRYFNAATADELKTAAREVVKETANHGWLKVMAVRNGEPLEAMLRADIEGAEEPAVSVRLYRDVQTKGVKVPPGAYRITAIDDQTAGAPSIDLGEVSIEQGKTVELTADFTSGILMVGVTKNGETYEARVGIYKPGTEDEVADGTTARGPRKFSLPAGRYDLRVIDDYIYPRVTITVPDLEIPPGQTVEQNFDIPQGRLGVRILEAGRPVFGWVYVYDAESGDSVRANDTSSHNPIFFNLQPGVYRLEVERKRQKQVVENVEVEAAQTKELDVNYSPQKGD
jgi:Ca-activated chloride channel family protein